MWSAQWWPRFSALPITICYLPAESCLNIHFNYQGVHYIKNLLSPDVCSNMCCSVIRYTWFVFVFQFFLFFCILFSIFVFPVYLVYFVVLAAISAFTFVICSIKINRSINS